MGPAWGGSPLSMVSNSFSSPVMRGMRVHGVLALVATAYTWGVVEGHHMPGMGPERVPGLEMEGQGAADLGLHVVSHIVGCAAQRDLPDGPRGIIGQVGRQDTDPQLTLGADAGTSEARHPLQGAGEPRPLRAPWGQLSVPLQQGHARAAGPVGPWKGHRCCPVLHRLPTPDILGS